jgi:hypothetical protein
MNDPIVTRCIVCEQLTNSDDEGRTDVMNTYTDGPCMKCVNEIKGGNFLFVLISDKSDEERINRLHQTWIVPIEEVQQEFGDLDIFNDERVVFITESEALDVGLLDERITDPETGIRYDQMDNKNGQ